MADNFLPPSRLLLPQSGWLYPSRMLAASWQWILPLAHMLRRSPNSFAASAGGHHSPSSRWSCPLFQLVPVTSSCLQRHLPLTVFASVVSVLPVHEPQAPGCRYLPFFTSLVSLLIARACLQCRIHLRCAAHSQQEQCCH